MAHAVAERQLRLLLQLVCILLRGARRAPRSRPYFTQSQRRGHTESTAQCFVRPGGE